MIYDYVATAFGRVNLSADNIGNFALGNIAYATMKIPRFNGHSTKPYSLFDHCFNVAAQVDNVFSTKFKIAFLHDAAEVVIGDMPGPVKAFLRERTSAFDNLESKLLREIIEEVVGEDFDSDFCQNTLRAAKVSETNTVFPSEVHNFMKDKFLQISPPATLYAFDQSVFVVSRLEMAFKNKWTVDEFLANVVDDFVTYA